MRLTRSGLRRALWYGALLACALLSGCGGSGSGSADSVPSPAADSTLPPAVAEAIRSAAAVPPEIVTADNAFGLQLLDTLLRQHRAVVEVDETGTTAAGATGITVGITAAPQRSMTMDRPFFYAIRDEDTGVFLFVGALQDPTEPQS